MPEKVPRVHRLEFRDRDLSGLRGDFAMSENQSVPWIKWEFSHWLGGKISRRPAIEQAVFINLQALIMKEGGPIELPDEDRLDMADRLHVDADDIDKAIDNLAARKIIENVGGELFTIKFLAEKMQSVEEIRERRRLAGARGGLAKASKCQASATETLASATNSLANASSVVAEPTREGEGVREGERELLKNKPKKSPQFKRPTIEEVTEYADSRSSAGNRKVDPIEFMDHYEANGWVRGKTAIKDWRACLRTWERGSNGGTGNRRPPDQHIGGLIQHGDAQAVTEIPF